MSSVSQIVSDGPVNTAVRVSGLSDGTSTAASITVGAASVRKINYHAADGAVAVSWAGGDPFAVLTGNSVWDGTRFGGIPGEGDLVITPLGETPSYDLTLHLRKKMGTVRPDGLVGGTVTGIVPAISFVMAQSVAASSLIPPPGLPFGDLILLGALQTNDATLPALVNDWLAPVADATHVISAVGAAAAGILAYKTVDSDTEMGGNFGSAQIITQSVYHGVSASNPILYCNMMAGTVSPVSYPALNSGNPFSEPCWVVLMQRTQNVVTVPTPDGFIVRDIGTRRETLDSGRDLTSFAQSDQTVGTPGKWVSIAFAIKKA